MRGQFSVYSAQIADLFQTFVHLLVAGNGNSMPLLRQALSLTYLSMGSTALGSREAEDLVLVSAYS
ncbi:hypothetical protein ACVWYG_002366 [Pedobacter sp. UYEF25]